MVENLVRDFLEARMYEYVYYWVLLQNYDVTKQHLKSVRYPAFLNA